ncbi:hypothetical protein D3C72_2537000 [compost metagenome]|jgi:hypothetical protein
MLAKVGQGFSAALAGAWMAVTSVGKTGVAGFICVADAEPIAANANRPKSTIRGSWNFMREGNL